jgi:hypothetical protein
MYNPDTQVQIPVDANLGSYYLFKKKLAVGVSPTAFLSKNLEILKCPASKNKTTYNAHIPYYLFSNEPI